MTTSTADDGFAALMRKITRERGFGCASYKEKCLRRRIAVRMRARAVHTFDDYARALDRDAHEYDLLLDALTINVTKLFRNWETWDAVERDVIPALWERADAPIRVWSAGCSSGEEPYSLAVLFHRYAEVRGHSGRASRVQILASDIDRRSLERAQVAEYDEAAFADTPGELRRAYFSPTAPFTVRSDVRAMVRVERRDLLAEPTPPGLFHLIVCRNVVIYFDRDSQEALFHRFHDALVPGGFLLLGKVETLLGPVRSSFTPLNSRERIFRRL